MVDNILTSPQGFQLSFSEIQNLTGWNDDMTEDYLSLSVRLRSVTREVLDPAIPDIDAILEALTGRITENELFIDLNTRIDLIDAPETGIVTQIQVTNEVIDGVQGKYSVKIDDNGHVTGYGLISEANDGDPVSTFIVSVDKFLVAFPGSTPVIPFIIGQVDGVSTVGINGQLVVDGTISGRKITTGRISGNDGHSYWDLTTNRFFFSSFARLTFNENGNVNINGSSTTVELQAIDNRVTVNSAGGVQIVGNGNASNFVSIQAGTGGMILDSEGATRITSDTSFSSTSGTTSTITVGTTASITAGGSMAFTSTGAATLQTSNLLNLRSSNSAGTNWVVLDRHAMHPNVNNGINLGLPGLQYFGIYGSAFFDDGVQFQDLQDDLVVLSEVKARKDHLEPESGLEFMDLLSVPRWMTNYNDAKSNAYTREDGEDTDGAFEAWVESKPPGEYPLRLNMGKHVGLVSGGLRQLDRELHEDLLPMLAARITLLETKLTSTENN